MASFCGVPLVPFRQRRLGRGGQRRRRRRAGKHTKKRQSACVSDFLVHSGTLLCGKLTIYYCQGLALLGFFCFCFCFNFLLLVFVLMWTISGVLTGCVWGASQVAQW